MFSTKRVPYHTKPYGVYIHTYGIWEGMDGKVYRNVERKVEERRRESQVSYQDAFHVTQSTLHAWHVQSTKNTRVKSYEGIQP